MKQNQFFIFVVQRQWITGYKWYNKWKPFLKTKKENDTDDYKFTSHCSKSKTQVRINSQSTCLLEQLPGRDAKTLPLKARGLH